MIHYKYKGVDVTPGLYTLEYKDSNGNECIDWDDSIYAYQRLLIKAYDLQIDGYIVYCLTRTRQKIMNGFPIKRGRKRSKDRTDSIGSGFRKEIQEAPARLQVID